VPTGNFGNVYAAWAARRMGLPVQTLTVATNRNDILARFFESGTMRAEKVAPSLSPSMDIQVSSNFERYLFELLGRDPAALTALMERFAAKKTFDVAPGMLARAQDDFRAARGSDDDTVAMMRACYDATGIVIDPHTAVGLHAAQAMLAADPATPVVALACAHPAKFPDAVRQALGHAAPVPPRLAALAGKAEHVTVLPPDIDRLKALLRRGPGG
jgi:threonine synthase